MIYLDHAATTPLLPEVKKAMLQSMDQCFGNASSYHGVGRGAHQCVEKARSTMAKHLGVRAGDIIFTSSATEANNTLLKGLVSHARRKNPEKPLHIITSSIEHACILETTQYLASLGVEITYLKVDHHGRIDTQELASSLRPETLLVSIMAANNEVGTLQPLKEVAKIIEDYRRKHNKQDIFLHSDMVQYFPYFKVSLSDFPLHAFSLSAHKFGGPQGVGMLYLHTSLHQKCTPLLHGGGQEYKLRSGTENVPGIVGMVKAVESTRQHREEKNAHMLACRDMLLDLLLKQFPSLIVNTDMQHCLPGFLNISFPGINGETLLYQLSQEGIYLSTGSACATSDTQDKKQSHVLHAMGLSKGDILGSIRISLGKECTFADVRKVATSMIEKVEFLQRINL